MTPRQQAILDLARRSPDVRAIIEFLVEIGGVDEKTAILACRAKMPILADKMSVITGNTSFLDIMRKAPVMSDRQVFELMKEFVRASSQGLDIIFGNIPN